MCEWKLHCNMCSGAPPGPGHNLREDRPTFAVYNLAELVVEHAAVLRAEVISQLRNFSVGQGYHRPQGSRQHRHEL